MTTPSFPDVIKHNAMKDGIVYVTGIGSIEKIVNITKRPIVHDYVNKKTLKYKILGNVAHFTFFIEAPTLENLFKDRKLQVNTLEDAWLYFSRHNGGREPSVGYYDSFESFLHHGKMKREHVKSIKDVEFLCKVLRADYETLRSSMDMDVEYLTRKGITIDADMRRLMKVPLLTRSDNHQRHPTRDAVTYAAAVPVVHFNEDVFNPK